MRILCLSTLGLAATLALATPASAQNSPGPVRGTAYALGVHMGFASYALTRFDSLWPADDLTRFIGTVTSTTSDRDVERAAWCNRAKQELTSAKTYVLGLNAHFVASRSETRLAPPNLSASAQNTCPTPDYIVELRNEYAGGLARTASDISSAYNLGINLSIAEIQAASGGEPARGIVIAALSNARAQVDALGLNPQPLEEAWRVANQPGRIKLVYDQIVTARTTYQAAF
jgi:hypothetical protein